MTDKDWINAMAGVTEMDTPHDMQKIMSNERGNAEIRVLSRLAAAMRKYVAAHNGEFPTEISGLVNYLGQPIESSTLDRYEIVRADELVTNLQGDSEWVLTEKAPVNKTFDSRDAYGLKTCHMADMNVTNRWNSISNP